jgi:hypothetical protein
MGVSESEYKILFMDNPFAVVVGRNAYKEVSGIILQVKGIRGGIDRHCQDKLNLQKIHHTLSPLFGCD